MVDCGAAGAVLPFCISTELFDSGQRLSYNFCQDACLCHFLATAVYVGREGGDEEEKKTRGGGRQACVLHSGR